MKFEDIIDNDIGIIDVDTSISKFNNSMRHFMKDLLSLFAEEDHHKLQTLKNHQNLHYDRNIRAFGAVPNFNGGCNEQNRK